MTKETVNQPAIKENQENDIYPIETRVFSDTQKFKEVLSNEEESLIASAKKNKELGITTKDQDLPSKAFFLYKNENTLKPTIIVVGGMGSLAGVQSGKMTAEKFGNDRNIILYQLTATPDRTEAIKQDDEMGAISPMHQQVVGTLDAGIKMVNDLAKTYLNTESADVVVICNTAHRFLPEVKMPKNLHLVSLIDSTVKRLKDDQEKTGKIKLSALYTDGTRMSKVYSDKFKNVGIDFVEPDAEKQQHLMSAIYQGVKAFDKETAICEGEKALQFLKQDKEITHLLAGCTEIPEIIKWIKENGKDQEIISRLNEVVIINPAEEALNQIASSEITTNIDENHQKINSIV